ncbi:MAG: YtxH domain-containing protein [Planctomycetota bacterium]|nr:YtxH domain-containing protein [Planctomycetota bacterium]
MKRASSGVAGAVVLGVLFAGCNAPPKGEQTRRVEVSDTTKAERRSAQVQPAALVEFSDQVAQQLTEDLIALPEFNSGQRVSVVFGDLVNKTGIVPTSDFEAFRTRVRQKLVNSSVARSRIRWIESRAKMEELRRLELGGVEGETGSTTPLNPGMTYFLNGEMYRVERGAQEVNLYMLSFSLSNAQSRELIWTNTPYEVKQTPGR